MSEVAGPFFHGFDDSPAADRVVVVESDAGGSILL
jgi:hypothetical protein